MRCDLEHATCRIPMPMRIQRLNRLSACQVQSKNYPFDQPVEYLLCGAPEWTCGRTVLCSDRAFDIGLSMGDREPPARSQPLAQPSALQRSGGMLRAAFGLLSPAGQRARLTILMFH